MTTANTDRNRVAETRNMDTRESQARYNMQMTTTHYLDRAMKDKPENMEYKWITDHIRNDSSFSRMGEYGMVGWTPVRSDRHPNMAMGLVSWRDNPYDGYIQYKGAVLCERPKEFGEYERQLADEQRLRAMVELPGLDNLMSEPTMPGRVFANETSRIKTQRMATFKQ